MVAAAATAEPHERLHEECERQHGDREDDRRGIPRRAEPGHGYLVAVGEGLRGQGGHGQGDGAENGAPPRKGAHPVDGARAALLVLAVLAAGCGGGAGTAQAFTDPHSRPIGRGAAYHPGPRSMLVGAARPVRGLRWGVGGGKRFGVHLEIFVNRLVVIVPAGIGIAPPLHRRGAYVVGGRCSYPARTIEPTGVMQVLPGNRVSLGDFFALWGRPFEGERLFSFSGKVLAYVDGVLWRGPPGAIPLSRHREITLEVGGRVPPRVGYRFRPGL